MNEVLQSLGKQAPALALFAGAGIWCLRAFFRHLSGIEKSHAEAMKNLNTHTTSVVETNSTALDRNTEMLGACAEAYRKN